MNERILKLAFKKGYDAKTREVTGWANRSDSIDRDGEVILASTWKDPESTKHFMRHPILMASHQVRDSLPLGRVTKLEPRPEGLWFRAKFSNTAAAKEAAGFIEDTALAAFSVGFLGLEKVEKSVRMLRKMGVDCGRFPDAKMISCWTRVELLEISLVSLPSSRMSTALGAAYVGGLVKTKELKSVLDRWITVEKDEPDKVPAYVAQALEKALSNALSPEVFGDTLAKSLEKLREKVGDPEPEIIVDKTADELSDAELEAMVKRSIDNILTPSKLEKMVRDAVALSVAKIQGKVF